MADVEIETIILQGVFASRPAAADALEYYATDTDARYWSDGATWFAQPAAVETHVHAGADITSGTVADARIASTIARDAEITADISTHAAIGAAHAAAASQAEMEAGTEAALRSVSPLRVAQAIAALASGSGVPQGTSFPGGPSAGDQFFRTDLGFYCYFDGTRWLTTTLYREPIAGEMSALASHSGNDTVGRLPVWHTTYDLWLDTLYVTSFVTTTNNGTNFWTVTLNKTDAANASTLVTSFSTGTTPDTASTWVTRSLAIGALLAAATHKQVKLDLTKTLAPGNIFAIAALAYRLIVT